MSTREQFIGGIKSPKVLNNYWSGLGASATPLYFDNSETHLPGKKYTPSLTASTLTTLLSVTGSGGIDVLMFRENAAGVKTVRIKVTIDGTVIFDQTSPSVTLAAGTGAQGLIVLGLAGKSWNGTYVQDYIAGGQNIIFNSSLLIEVESSTTNAYTDFFVNYRTN